MSMNGENMNKLQAIHALGCITRHIVYTIPRLHNEAHCLYNT